MFSSIGVRLILSYALVIFVALALVFLTFVVVARPLQERVTHLHLSRQLNGVIQSAVPTLEEGATPQDIGRALAEAAQDQDARLLLVRPDGTVLGDTDGAWGGQKVQIDLPAMGGMMGEGQGHGQGQGQGFGSRSARGVMSGPAGDMLYVAAPLRNGSVYLLAVAPVTGEQGGSAVEFWRGFLLAGVVSFLLSLMLAFFISRSVTVPLRKVAKATERIADGHYDERVDIRGPDELRKLGDGFNEMASKVQVSQQTTRDLVYNVSHDLKTPLTSIRGFSQALIEDAPQDEESRRRAVLIIHEEAARMTRMVEDLLDLARIDMGQLIREEGRVDVPALVEGMMDAVAGQAADKGVELRCNIEVYRDVDKDVDKEVDKEVDTGAGAALPPVRGDGDRLAQVFANLLDNAIKYTPRGGRVSVTVRGLGRAVEVSVADTGPGIPSEDLERVFERFYRVDKSRRQRKTGESSGGRGTGLGLAIAREIVEAHGGSIRAESVEGIGSRFVVLLPVDVVV